MDRYRSRNDVEHLSTAEYKAKKILEKAESKKAETEDYAEWQKQRQLNIKNQKNVAPL